MLKILLLAKFSTIGPRIVPTRLFSSAGAKQGVIAAGKLGNHPTDAAKRLHSPQGPFLSENGYDCIKSVMGRNEETYCKLLLQYATTRLPQLPLEEVITESHGDAKRAAIYQIASQLWNQQFYLSILHPTGKEQGETPVGDFELAAIFEYYFESYERFRKEFSQSALAMVGVGWTWLCRLPSGPLKIFNTYGTTTPLVAFTPQNPTNRNVKGSGTTSVTYSDFPTFRLTQSSVPEIEGGTEQKIGEGNRLIPLFGINMWEHAYLTDYGADRAAYVNAFFGAIDWERVRTLMRDRILDATTEKRNRDLKRAQLIKNEPILKEPPIAQMINDS